jgi:hypothetical protein
MHVWTRTISLKGVANLAKINRDNKSLVSLSGILAQLFLSLGAVTIKLNDLGALSLLAS